MASRMVMATHSFDTLCCGKGWSPITEVAQPSSMSATATPTGSP